MKKIQKLAIVSTMTIALAVSNNDVTIHAADMNQIQEVSLQRYQIPVSLWHATKDQESMANSAIKKQAIIEVSEDKTTVYLYTEAMNMLGITANIQHLYIKNVDGSSVEAQVESYNEDESVGCFSFEVDVLEEFIEVTVDAGIMTADARLKFNLEEMTEVKEEEKEEIKEEEQQEKIQEINLNIWHATQEQSSMMDSCVDTIARVVSKDGKYRVYVYTSVLTIGTISGYVTGLQVMDPNGEVSIAEIERIDENGIATCYSFELSELVEYYDAIVTAEVPIPGMSEMNIRLKLDLNSLVDVNEAIDLTIGKQEPEVEIEEEDTSDTTSEEEVEDEEEVEEEAEAEEVVEDEAEESTIDDGVTNQGNLINTTTSSEQNSSASNSQENNSSIIESEDIESEKIAKEDEVVVIIEETLAETEVIEDELQEEEFTQVAAESQPEDKASATSILVRATAGVSTVILAGLYTFERITNKKKHNKGKK